MAQQPFPEEITKSRFGQEGHFRFELVVTEMEFYRPGGIGTEHLLMRQEQGNHVLEALRQGLELERWRRSRHVRQRQGGAQ